MSAYYCRRSNFKRELLFAIQFSSLIQVKMSLVPLFGNFSMDPAEELGWGRSPCRRGEFYNQIIPSFKGLMRAANHIESGCQVAVHKDRYTMSVDVHQFAPEEITVKTVGDQVIIEGKHEEKQDDHGCVYRHFVRKYDLPADHRAEDVVSSLSSDGVLTITAPRKKSPVEGERVVPITTTGTAHKPVSQ